MRYFALLFSDEAGKNLQNLRNLCLALRDLDNLPTGHVRACDLDKLEPVDDAVFVTLEPMAQTASIDSTRSLLFPSDIGKNLVELRSFSSVTLY